MNNQPLSPGLLKNIGFLVSQSDRPARLGLAGNQPLRTRSTCSFTSLMLQKQLKAVTPSNDEPMTDPFYYKRMEESDYQKGADPDQQTCKIVLFYEFRHGSGLGIIYFNV